MVIAPQVNLKSQIRCRKGRFQICKYIDVISTGNPKGGTLETVVVHGTSGGYDAKDGQGFDADKFWFPDDDEDEAQIAPQDENTSVCRVQFNSLTLLCQSCKFFLLCAILFV